MVLGPRFRCFCTTFFGFVGNRELVKISVSLKRELDFQGLAGFGSVCFVLFFRVWFLDGFGNRFLVVLGSILGAFWLPKSMKNVIDFGIDF